MEDLGYPNDNVELVEHIYTNSTTSFYDTHFGTMAPIHFNQ